MQIEYSTAPHKGKYNAANLSNHAASAVCTSAEVRALTAVHALCVYVRNVFRRGGGCSI